MGKTKYKTKRKYKKKNKGGSLKSLKNQKQSMKLCKSYNVKGIGRYLNMFNYTFVRFADTQKLIEAVRGPTDVSEAFTFAFEEIQNESEFGNLFDQFRVLQVEMVFRPLIQHVNQLMGSTLSNEFEIPTIYITNDWDDSVGMTISQMRQKSDVIIKQVTEPFTIKVTPQAANTMWKSSLASSYGTPYEAKWIDLANDDTELFGLKYLMSGTGITPSGTGPTFGYNITYQYLFQCRTLR